MIYDVTFQFTRPQGARHNMTITTCDSLSFNSRAHKGRDHALRYVRCVGFSFNSRAHKGRDLNELFKSARIQFQFTRPQGARLGNLTGNSIV